MSSQINDTDPSPCSFQESNALCSFGRRVFFISRSGPMPSLRGILNERYFCESKVPYYIDTNDKDSVSWLIPGESVTCDRRLLYNNVMWLHCVRSLYDDRKDRPENSVYRELR